MAKRDYRQMPQNIEAEQATLGAMLINEEAVRKASEKLTSKDFYRQDHAIIFEYMLKLHENHYPVDMVTVAEALAQESMLEKAGGMELISSLNSAVPTAANIDFYANIVKEKSVQREIINISTEIATSAYDSEDIHGILEKAEKMFMSLSAQTSRDSSTNFSSVLVDALEYVEKLHNADGQILGLPTGFTSLDRQINGLQKSDLILLAARPAMGKTAFALNIITSVLKAGHKAAFFSLEMSSMQLTLRILSSLSMINLQQPGAKLGEKEWDDLLKYTDTIYRWGLFIEDISGLNLRELRARARKLKADEDIDFIVIDYLQLMQGSGKENRQLEISEISRGLKILARELNVPILCLSQLNRGVESRQDKRPMLSDLRDSGSLEQDADIVMFLYREEYYNHDTDLKNVAELIISKHRNGPIGTLPFFFDKDHVRFGELEIGYGKRER